MISNNPNINNYYPKTDSQIINKANNSDLTNKESGTQNNFFVVNENIDPGFEYKGYYKFGHVLGRGRFGTVVECLRKADNKPIALKFFKYSGIHKWIPESMILDNLDEKNFALSEFFGKPSKNSGERMLPSEVASLIRASKLKGIVKILDYLPANEGVQLDEADILRNEPNDESIIGIVLERNPKEMCLFDYLIQKEVLCEEEARVIITQIVQISLDLLHAGILHGDLKSENILIDPRTRSIKLIDFGSAQFMDLPLTKRASKCNGDIHKNTTSSSRLVKTFRGTNLYKPPEYLLHHCFYPRPSTVWTLGIILYDMVCGHFPFENDTDVLTHQDKEVLFTKDDLSNEFKDLVKQCLAFYVADRIVIEKILIHPWILEMAKATR